MEYRFSSLSYHEVIKLPYFEFSSIATLISIKTWHCFSHIKKKKNLFLTSLLLHHFLGSFVTKLEKKKKSCLYSLLLIASLPCSVKPTLLGFPSHSSGETSLLKVTQESVLLNPMINFQSSSYLTYQQYLIHCSLPPHWYPFLPFAPRESPQEPDSSLTSLMAPFQWPLLLPLLISTS